MPQIAQCSACNAQIAIPSGAGASALLRCPSCDVEFELEDVTATTLHEAVLLETSAAASFLDFEDAEADDVDPEMAIEDGFDFLDDDDDIVDVNNDGESDEALQGSPFEDVTNEVMDDLVDAEAVTEATVSAPAPTDENDDDLVMEIPVEEPDEAAPWNFGEPSDQPQRVAVGPSATSTAVAASMASRAAALRKPKKSFLRHLLNFFGGGVIGLALGYFILLWIGGPERDFLELGNKLPPWMVPASFSGPPVNGPPVNGQSVNGQSVNEQSVNEQSVNGQSVKGPSVKGPSVDAEMVTTTPQRGFAELAKELPSEIPEVTPGVPENMPDATVPETTVPETTTSEDAGKMPVSPFSNLADKPAAPIAPGPVALGLSDAQPVTMESLATAIDAARENRTNLVLEGDLTNKVTRRKKSASYIAFCALAETMTRIADAMASGVAMNAPEAEQVSQLDAAKQTIAETIAGEKTLSEVGMTARGWLGITDRTNRGVIAVGHVLGTYDCAPYAGLLLKLEGVPSTVPVVSAQPLPHGEGDRIVVAGLIVDAPAEHLNNFSKTPQRIIYAGQTFGAK